MCRLFCQPPASCSCLKCKRCTLLMENCNGKSNFLQVCCDYLKKQLDASNCLGIRAFADTHACRELLRIADKYTYHNFQEVH